MLGKGLLQQRGHPKARTGEQQQHHERVVEVYVQVSSMRVGLGVCVFAVDRDDIFHRHPSLTEGTLIGLLQPNVQTAPAELQTQQTRHRDTRLQMIIIQIPPRNAASQDQFILLGFTEV